jgi:galactokinase
MKVQSKNQFLNRFLALFPGKTEQIRVFFAPGRVNLIGEHTDYNGGCVFPAALPYGVWAFVRPREDKLIRLQSLNFDNQVDCDIDEIVYKQEDDWANYPKGVIQQLKKQGFELSGADIMYYGDIPNGAGLSSSAAIELVTAFLMKEMNQLSLKMLDLVRLSQAAENQFVGVNCGIMDQFAVGMGKENHALFLNCQTLEYDHVPVFSSEYQIVITNTNKRRGLADSKYNERRQECEQGLAIIQKSLPNIQCLGDLKPQEWEKVKSTIKNETIRRRVQHVIEENERVHRAKDVLKSNQMDKFGQLMRESHESLRDLYEVTGQELDAIFEIASKVEGCIGSRMTGAGFGGCNVSFVKKEAVNDFKRIVGQEYTERIGLTPSFYVCQIGSGTREVSEEVEKWPS